MECALFGGAQISGTRSFSKWRTISGAGLPRHVEIYGIFRDSHRNYGLGGAATWGAPHIRVQAYPAFGGALFLQGAHRFGVRSLWGCTNIGNTLFFEMANYFGGGLASACRDIRDFPGFASELCTGIWRCTLPSGCAQIWGAHSLGVQKYLEHVLFVPRT